MQNTRRCYSSSHWAEYTSFDLQFGDNSEELRLDVDPEVLESDGKGWTVLPIVTPLLVSIDGKSALEQCSFNHCSVPIKHVSPCKHPPPILMA